MNRDVVALGPLGKLVFIEEHTRSARTIDNGNVCVVCAMPVKKPADYRPQGGERKSAGDDHQVMPPKLLKGIPVAQRPAHAGGIACIKLVHGICDQTSAIYGEPHIVLLGGCRRDTERRFPFAQDRDLAELTGQKLERFLVFGVYELQVKRLKHPVLGLHTYVLNSHGHRQVRIRALEEKLHRRRLFH